MRKGRGHCGGTRGGRRAGGCAARQGRRSGGSRRPPLEPGLCSSAPAGPRGPAPRPAPLGPERHPRRHPPSRVGSGRAFRCAFRPTSPGRKCRRRHCRAAAQPSSPPSSSVRAAGLWCRASL
ncbi:hypothetical protein VULLAG_LOCUS14723 [Vulpes lagopus]